MKAIKEKLVILMLLAAFVLAGASLAHSLKIPLVESMLMANDCDKEDPEEDPTKPADSMPSNLPA